MNVYDHPQRHYSDLTHVHKHVGPLMGLCLDVSVTDSHFSARLGLCLHSTHANINADRYTCQCPNSHAHVLDVWTKIATFTARKH